MKLTKEQIQLEINRLNTLDSLETTFVSKTHPQFDKYTKAREALDGVRLEFFDMRQEVQTEPYPTDILVLWNIEDSPLQLRYAGDGDIADFHYDGEWVYGESFEDGILSTTKDLVKPYVDEVMSKFDLADLKSKTVTYENADILVTDPCYVLDYDFFGFDGPVETPVGFENFAFTNTASGDGGWEITAPDGTSLGSCGADAGMMGVYDINNLLKVFPDKDMTPEFLSSDRYDHVGTVFKNFTGTVTIFDKPLTAPYWGRGTVPAIKAEGTVNFEIELY